MKKSEMHWLVLVVLSAVMTLTSGCAAFRASTREVPLGQEKHFDADFDATDMRKITEGVVSDMAGSPFLAQADDRPIMMVAGIQNRTSEYVDTKNLTDRMRTLLIQSGRASFINEARREDLLKEQGYQAAHASDATQSAIGQQLGADFMVSGSLTEMRQTSPRQVRISKKQWNYYKLTVEVTDLESGLIVWTTEREFQREASKPLIGW